MSQSHIMALNRYTKVPLAVCGHSQTRSSVLRHLRRCAYDSLMTIYMVCVHMWQGVCKSALGLPRTATPGWECWDRCTVYFWVSDSVSMAADASQRKALRYQQTLVWPNFSHSLCSFCLSFILSHFNQPLLHGGSLSCVDILSCIVACHSLKSWSDVT